jgi:DNA polymerase III epsilon subunit-like protein
MHYVSIDLETTGTDPEHNQILEFGAIFEDSNIPLPFEELRKFKRILQHPNYFGQAIAINMNKRIFEILAKYDKLKGDERLDYAVANNIILPEQLYGDFHEFVARYYGAYRLIPSDGVNVAGKNFPGFDNLFLKKLCRDNGSPDFPFNRRFADPATPYVDWKNDDSLPNLAECKKRAGVEGEVTHDALQDAWDVIQVLRKKY